jgi:hypothetical protein
MKNISLMAFLGGLMAVAGVCTLGALIGDNWKIKWHVWEKKEQAGAIGGGVGVIIGLLLVLCGCGGSQSYPQPTDPVTVEVVACEPTLGTSGQYLKLSSWRREVGVCAAMRADLWDRQEILDAAERDVDRLGQEYDAYRVSGQTDCYCGPVCLEVTGFLEGARGDGLFCGP